MANVERVEGYEQGGEPNPEGPPPPLSPLLQY